MIFLPGWRGGSSLEPSNLKPKRKCTKTCFSEAGGKCLYARLPKPGTRPQGGESKRSADKFRGMRRTRWYAAEPPARRAYAPEGRGMRVTQQMGVFRQLQRQDSACGRDNLVTSLLERTGNKLHIALFQSKEIGALFSKIFS
jgi:hypothetical protein